MHFMDTTPFDIDMQLEGWRLFWAQLRVEEVNSSNLAARRRQIAESARSRVPDTASISGDRVVAALRTVSVTVASFTTGGTPWV